MAKKTAAKKGAATSRPAKSARPAAKSAAKSRPAARTATGKAAATAKKSAPRKPAAPKTPKTRKTASQRPAPTAAQEPRVGDLPRGHRPEAAPVPPASPTGKKVSSGLSKKDLAYFRDLLLEKRHELVGDMSSMEREALRTSGGSNLSTLPIHMADQGTDNYEQEFTLGLVEKDRVLLRQINSALAKIQNGTYGICEGTGQPISRPRLEAQPWARYSIEYARQMEKRGIR